MLIRPATASDIPNMLPMIAKICALHQSWDAAKYGFLPNPEQRYQSWLKQLLKNPRNLCLVAENLVTENSVTEDSATENSATENPIADRSPSPSNPTLAAFLIATVEREIPIYTLQEFGFIHDLWVEAEHRQEGIARQLVQQAIEHFTRIGIQQIRLDTAAKNDIARQLFAACGFRVSMVELLIELPR